MRSRYCAYAQANVDYITQTMKGKAAVGFDADGAKAWAQQSQWLGLKVLRTRWSAANKDIGYVEFKARLRYEGKVQTIHELSEFHRENGRWFYVDRVEP